MINVLKRLKSYNVRVNKAKCKFFETSVEFLGHIVDANGIHPTLDKIECIQKPPTPQNLTQLKSYLGLLNYYDKFIPMLLAKFKPLYELCKAETDFKWNNKHENTFQLNKTLLTSANVLTHFDPKLLIVITSSGYGVGAILSHIKGEEKPVLSSTLSKAEQRYSNIERESCINLETVRFPRAGVARRLPGFSVG